MTRKSTILHEADTLPFQLSRVHEWDCRLSDPIDLSQARRLAGPYGDRATNQTAFDPGQDNLALRAVAGDRSNGI